MNSTECSCRNEFQVAEKAETLVQEATSLLGPHFRRQRAQQHAMDYLRGLISDVERKNGWQLAEHAGYPHPRGIQRVLDRYSWDHQAVREDLRQYVVTELGDPEGTLVVDETGFVKQGKHSAGVARQYCGNLGKIANCQVGVFPSVNSGQAWVMPAPRVILGLMAPSSCRKDGSRNRNAVSRLEFLREWTIAPNLSWPWRCWNPLWMREYPPAGWWGMKPTAVTESCGGPWRLGSKRTCWRCAAMRNPPPGRPMAGRDNMLWQSWAQPSRPRGGRDTVVVREPRGLGSIIGPTFPAVRPYEKVGSMPCCSGDI